MDKYLTKSNYSTKLHRLSAIDSGLLRNFTRRSLIAQDQPWWATNNSPWKLTIVNEDPTSDVLTPDYWIEEALSLCEIELTHQYFGLTFNDLMAMDPATFTKIKERIYDFSRRKYEKLSPEIAKELKK